MITKFRPKFVLFLMLLISLSGYSSARAEEPVASVVVLFGDSITHGFNSLLSNPLSDEIGGGRTDRGCPTFYLANILNNLDDREGLCPVAEGDSAIRDANQNFANASVQNWGNSGSTTALPPPPLDGRVGQNGIERIDSDLKAAFADGSNGQRFVLIMYGTNDFGFGIDPTETGAHTGIMIDIARSNGFTPVVSPLIPRNPSNANGQVQNLASYNNQINAAISSRGADTVDLNARFINEPGGFQTLLDDGLHPTDEGYLVIAETWFNEFLSSRIASAPVPVDSNALIAPILLLLLDDE